MNDRVTFKRQRVPLGDDWVSVLVARSGDEARSVFMSYDSFLELVATLTTAIDALKACGADLGGILGDDDEEFVAAMRQTSLRPVS